MSEGWWIEVLRLGEIRTLVVVHDVTEMVFAAVVRLSDTHRVVGEVHIAIVTFERQLVVCLWM